MSDTTESVESHGHDKDFHIIVNGEPKALESKVVTFDEAVRLAFPDPDPNTIYSVTFERAEKPHEGELVKGQEVAVKNGTELDVTPTGKS